MNTRDMWHKRAMKTNDKIKLHWNAYRHFRQEVNETSASRERYRLATGQKTFSYRGAKLYKSIAKDIRDTGNFNAFKKRIFKYIFNS